MRIFHVLLLLLATATPLLRADEDGSDWWDSFVNAVSTKIHQGADWIKEKAGPVVREKFDDVKAKLQDPETHEQFQTWFREKVVPVVQEKWNQAKQFVVDEVVPEAEKVYNAAKSAHEKLESENAD